MAWSRLLVSPLFLIAGPLWAEENLNYPADYPSADEIQFARQQIQKDFPNLMESQNAETETHGLLTKINTLTAYSYLDPKREVPQDLLQNAILFFDANKTGFPNQDYLSVVDLRARSDAYRFFLINLITGEVERFHTTHGRGSDPNKDGWATLFSNAPNSNKSSLGLARVGEVYFGVFRRSVRLDGLSNGNSNMRARAIVVHGWNDVKEKNVIQGLTNGCITLDWTIKDDVIDKIKEGSLMLIGRSGANSPLAY